MIDNGLHLATFCAVHLPPSIFLWLPFHWLPFHYRDLVSVTLSDYMMLSRTVAAVANDLKSGELS